MNRYIRTLGLTLVAAVASTSALFPAVSSARAGSISTHRALPKCEQPLANCPDLANSEAVFGEGHYVGHDETALLFYSEHPGAGNSYSTTLTLPWGSRTPPRQDGTGGVAQYQLHPAFWFSMAVCDPQSAPEYTHSDCTPNSDSNIAESLDPRAPDFLGKHPGSAFVEVQFYPPGDFNDVSCDQGPGWCAALRIFSFSFDQNKWKANNADCLSRVGIEPGNFAFLTYSGVADAPADPLNAAGGGIPLPTRATDLFMNSGDQLRLAMNDTPAGLSVRVDDLTTHQSGAMTASIANGFAAVNFDPSATTCTQRPYAFHPMYSTSSERTRVPWLAHTFSIAFSDEIGHFEFCGATTGFFGTCTAAGAQDPAGVDEDDTSCLSPSDGGTYQIGHCLDPDTDFDGTPYQKVWPGADPARNPDLTPEPVIFSSPLIGGKQNYSRVAFEANMPNIEFKTGCNIQRPVNCVNPPPGAAFYPIFTTRAGQDAGGDTRRSGDDGTCQWQLGGASIPGTVETFGGTSASEFGTQPPPFAFVFRGKILLLYPNFRRVLPRNPCPGQ